MNLQPISLAQLQRQMAAAILQPLTRDDGMRPETADGRSMAAVAESFIAPNSRLSVFERLEIYNRQYWFRVMGALAEDFPALEAVVGGRVFEALSIGYLTACPSRSFTLRNLGSRLVEWLAVNPHWGGRRHGLALDVARMEWAFVEAFDSAHRNPLTLEQIAALDASSRLALQPHVQLLALDRAADELVLALHDRQKREPGEAGQTRGQASAAPAKLPYLRPRPTWLAAHRVDLSVYYRRLEREEFLTLSAIGRGLPLAEALEAGFQDSRIHQPRRPQRVQTWFANWAELGWICARDPD